MNLNFSSLLRIKLVRRWKLYKKRNQDYGCFDFILYNEFNIDRENGELKFLINRDVINIRTKKAKSSDYVGDFVYLDHQSLVNRESYLYYNDSIYIFKDFTLTKIQEDQR